MIYQSTINSLTEDELSVLFFIFNYFFESIGIEPRIEFIKMMKIDALQKIIDVLRPQALVEKQEIFDSLKKKLSE